jgi:uncharacterized protein
MPVDAGCTAMRALPLVCGMTLCALAATAAELPRRPALGVEVVPSAQRGASVATIPAHVRWKGPALAVGDTITVIDGKPVASPADVTRMLNDRNLGDEVALEARRGEQSIRTGAAIVEQPRESSDRFAVDYLTLPLPEGRRRLVLLRPHGATPRPAVLMIGGLGCYPADNPFNPNEAQRALTHELSGAGYITLRVEKTGAGDSEGPPCADAPMQAEIDGLAAALRWLKRHPQVDASRVFIVGLSMGGIVGPRVAALEAVAGMAFFEIVGGTSWLEYELENRRRQLGLRDRPAAQIDQMVRDRAWCLNEVMVDRRARAEIIAARPACELELRYPVGDAYMQDVFAQNLPQLFLALKGLPLLVVYGEADFITTRLQGERLVEVINKEHAGSASFVPIAQMDHWLSRAASPQDSFERAAVRGQFVDTFNPAASEVLLGWLSQRVRR